MRYQPISSTVVAPIATRANAVNNEVFAFQNILVNDKIDVKVMGQWMEAKVLRKRQNGASWIIKFQGRLGRSVDLFENDENFPEVRMHQ